MIIKRKVRRLYDNLPKKEVETSNKKLFWSIKDGLFFY